MSVYALIVKQADVCAPVFCCTDNNNSFFHEVANSKYMHLESLS